MMKEQLGTDLLITHRGTLHTAIELVEQGGDLQMASGLENLQQAIRLRLATRQGDLEQLGHPDFGSRLYLLIGRRPTPESIALAKAYVHEALRRESRIAAIQRVDVAPDPKRPDSLFIEVTVQPVGAAAPVKVTAALELSPGAGAAPGGETT